MKEKSSHIGEVIFALVVIVGVFLLPGADIANKSIVGYPFIYEKTMESRKDHETVITMNDKEYVDLGEAKKTIIFNKEISFILLLSAVSLGVFLGMELEKRKEKREEDKE